MGFYLLDNPNPTGPNYYTSRRTCAHGKTKPHLIVVHTAEALPDWDGPDTAAEAVARYAATTTRNVSWHSTVDSDSTIPMLPDEYLAWHVVNYNSCALGIEMATQASKWFGSPDEWRYAILNRAAAVCRAWSDKFDISVKQLTKAEADRGLSGLVAHATLDPTRRTDPGPSFPWVWFIEAVKVPAPVANGTHILAPPSATAAQAVAYWRGKYAPASKYTESVVKDIAAAYWQYGPGYGVDPAIAFAQALKETGGFAFGNLVKPSQWNFAGIGATGPNRLGLPDHAPERGIWFLNLERGVRGHLLRLRTYAKYDGDAYDLTVLVRALPETYWGVAPTLEKLSGKWAVPGTGYGESIRDDYWKPLKATVGAVEPPQPPPATATDPLTPAENALVRDMLSWWRAQ